MTEKRRYRTRDLNEAAAIWAQRGFQVSFLRLEPTEKEGFFKFVFEVDSSEADLEKFLFDYVNGDTLVEPRRYDQRLNDLRDHVRMAKVK